MGNLPLDATEDELRQMFILFGEVISVIMMNDRYIGSGQLRGYGYVQMPSRLEGQAAVISLQAKTIRGQAISVVEALPLSDNGQPKAYPEKRGKYSSMRARRR